MLKKLRAIRIIAFAGLALLLTSSPAKADGVSITINAVTVTAGQSAVTVFGTLTDISGDIAFLNADSINLPVTLFVSGSINDNDFFNYVPLSLSNLDSTGLVPLFTFDVPSNAAPGVYTGNYVVLGGIGSLNSGNYDTIGNQNFTIDVTSPISTPEPGVLLQLVLGLGAVALGFRYWRSEGRVANP